VECKSHLTNQFYKIELDLKFTSNQHRKATTRVYVS